MHSGVKFRQNLNFFPKNTDFSTNFSGILGDSFICVETNAPELVFLRGRLEFPNHAKHSTRSLSCDHFI